MIPSSANLYNLLIGESEHKNWFFLVISGFETQLAMVSVPETIQITFVGEDKGMVPSTRDFYYFTFIILVVKRWLIYYKILLIEGYIDFPGGVTIYVFTVTAFSVSAGPP